MHRLVRGLTAHSAQTGYIMPKYIHKYDKLGLNDKKKTFV